MRWRDIRFEKPTAGHGDKDALILQLLTDGSIGKWRWDSLARITAWMPLSELPTFNPIPDPPEGWRFVDKDEAFDDRAKFWHQYEKQYVQQSLGGFSTAEHLVYIVPIDPPEPQYRSYNAAELKQLIGKLVDSVAGYRAMITGACGDAVFCQGQKVSAEALLKDHTWTDGGKCGVRAEQ